MFRPWGRERGNSKCLKEELKKVRKQEGEEDKVV
jgi:hypothetical protein